MVTQQKLKILHVIGQRPDSTGSGIYLQSMMREAAKCGHDNFMIAGIQPPDRNVELHSVRLEQCRFVRFNGGDISFLIPGMTDMMPYPSTRFADLSAQDIETYERAFARVLTETEVRFRPDIIHSHHNWLLSSLVRRLFPDIPVVTTCHGTDLRQFQNCPRLREKVLSGCRHLDAAMVLTGAQKEYIVRNYRLPPEKIIVTGAGYNDALFTAGSKPSPRPVQLVYAGKLSNAKGLPWLLKALRTITMPEWRMHIVGGGSGKEMEACMRLARDLGERVVVHGQIPQARLATIFGNAHIFVLPSLFEGLPLVMTEALASGCRVVATDLPGVMEVVGNVTADYISLVRTPRLRKMDQPYPEDLAAFEQNMAQALRVQMAGAIKHPRIDLSLIGDELDAFTWKRVFDRVQRVYFKVL